MKAPAAIATAQHGLGLANRMADVIARVIRERGHCRPRDLETKGFGRSEIAEAWATANALAHVQLGTPEDEL